MVAINNVSTEVREKRLHRLLYLVPASNIAQSGNKGRHSTGDRRFGIIRSGAADGRASEISDFDPPPTSILTVIQYIHLRPIYLYTEQLSYLPRPVKHPQKCSHEPSLHYAPPPVSLGQQQQRRHPSHLARSPLHHGGPTLHQAKRKSQPQQMRLGSRRAQRRRRSRSSREEYRSLRWVLDRYDDLVIPWSR